MSKSNHQKTMFEILCGAALAKPLVRSHVYISRKGFLFLKICLSDFKHHIIHFLEGLMNVHGVVFTAVFLARFVLKCSQLLFKRINNDGN